MKEYQPLTQQEIDEIIARHHFLVDKMNEPLGGVLKYEDEAIKQKLSDPKEVAAYRMWQEHKAREAERERIIASLEKDFGKNTLRDNPMKRTFSYCLKLGGTAADKAYNERLYQEYLHNPEKIVYREYSKILNLNPKDIVNLGDDKQALGEFYMDNTSFCEGAYAIQSAITSDDNHASNEMRKALASMKKPIETLVEIGNTVKRNGLDYFACPTLTPEQAAMSMGARDLFVGNPYPDLTEVINGKMGANTLESPKQYFENFEKYGMDINQPGFFVKYKCVLTDPQTGAREECSFDKLFKEDNPNARIEIRSKEEMFQIRAINSAFQQRYAEKFQSRIATKLNQTIFNTNQIEKDHEGGWFERNILHSTSPEWTAFMEAFKNFNDPEHPDYLKKDILKPKAEAYMDHKHAQGYASLEDMKGTSLKRGTLCQAVIDTCDELDNQEAVIKEDIDIAINTGMNGKVGLFINAKEVDVMGDMQPSSDKNEIKNEINIEKAPEVEEQVLKN